MEEELVIPHWLSRTSLLLGAEKVKKLQSANVLIVGLGGIGGICAEMIARAGVGRMTIVDADIVEASNRNRQIPALFTEEGKLKADVMAARLRAINPEIKVTVIAEFLQGHRFDEILDSQIWSYAVDCIDTLSPKVEYLKACYDRKIPVICSLGAGGKTDPSQVKIADIAKTHNCKLGRYVRKYLHQVGISKGIKAVFSPEPIDESRVALTPPGSSKKSVIGTISYMPAIFGCTVASVVIRDLLES